METVAAMKSYMPLVREPNTETAVTIARKISEAIRPYSMAVAPRSSRTKLRANR